MLNEVKSLLFIAHHITRNETADPSQTPLRMTKFRAPQPCHSEPGFIGEESAVLVAHC
jgi:hypothetical protein